MELNHVYWFIRPALKTIEDESVIFGLEKFKSQQILPHMELHHDVKYQKLVSYY